MAACCAGIITDTMLTAASEALPALIPARSKERGCVYPPLEDIRSGLVSSIMLYVLSALQT